MIISRGRALRKVRSDTFHRKVGVSSFFSGNWLLTQNPLGLYIISATLSLSSLIYLIIIFTFVLLLSRGHRVVNVRWWGIEFFFIKTLANDHDFPPTIYDDHHNNHFTMTSWSFNVNTESGHCCPQLCWDHSLTSLHASQLKEAFIQEKR